MKLRPTQFVYVVVLLSSLRLASASILPGGAYGTDGRYFSSVLCQDCAGVWTEIALLDAGTNWGNGSGTFLLIEHVTGEVHGGTAVLRQRDWSAAGWVKETNQTGTIKLRVIPKPEPRFLITVADGRAAIRALVAGRFILALPAASRAAYRTTWFMKSPAAQCMMIYTITGSGDRNVYERPHSEGRRPAKV